MPTKVRVASLGSGSKGNGTLIDDGETRILIDLGFTLKDAVKRLKRLDVDPASIDAVLVTHEHADHIHGVAGFARKFGTHVYLTPGTYQPKYMGQVPRLTRFNCHLPFTVESMEVTPVIVPHDAKEPCQFVVRAAGVSIGVLTDLGHITPHVEVSYGECDVLMLECNHDMEMLITGPYPYPLKQRVGGEYGHLNNEQAALLLTKIRLDRLKHLVISHVSEQNNKPELAEQEVKKHLGGWQGSLLIADQGIGLDWIEL